MRVLLGLAIAGLVGRAAPATADDDRISGFVTYGTGEVSGKVTDDDGKPLGGVAVHIANGSGAEQTLRSDKDGKFRIDLKGGGSSWVYVRGDARIAGQAIVPADGDGEVVEIHEVIPPSVPVKPLSNPFRIPRYSDLAIDRNQWTKAWLLLAIDKTGKVARLKLLKKPGLDLDATAISEGFKLEFEPALDRSKKPIDTLLLWAFEWPAYYWLSQHRSGISRMPDDASSVPCESSGPTHTTYRDCSHPDVAKSISAPWIDRPKH